MKNRKPKIRTVILSIPYHFDLVNDFKAERYLNCLPFWNKKTDKIKKYYKFVKVEFICNENIADMNCNTYRFTFEKLQNLKSYA